MIIVRVFVCVSVCVWKWEVPTFLNERTLNTVPFTQRSSSRTTLIRIKRVRSKSRLLIISTLYREYESENHYDGRSNICKDSWSGNSVLKRHRRVVSVSLLERDPETQASTLNETTCLLMMWNVALNSTGGVIRKNKERPNITLVQVWLCDKGLILTHWVP